MIQIDDITWQSNDGLITFKNMDCNDFMKGCKENEFDLIHNDPPYGIGQPKQSNLKGYKGRESLDVRLAKNRLNSGGGKLKDRKLNMSNCEWDNEIPKQDHFDLAFTVSKNQIIWGGNYFPLPPSRCIICWDKVQPWENFSQVELAWTSFDSPAQLFRFDNRTGDKIHPTQKPIELYKWILDKYTKPTDTILDCFGGSMSNAIACHMKRRNLTIIELDVDYFKSALNRFEIYERQVEDIKDFGYAKTKLNALNPTLF